MRRALQTRGLARDPHRMAGGTDIAKPGDEESTSLSRPRIKGEDLPIQTAVVPWPSVPVVHQAPSARSPWCSDTMVLTGAGDAGRGAYTGAPRADTWVSPAPGEIRATEQ